MSTGNAPPRVFDIQFFYDPISPYAYLAFERLPQALMGCSVSVRYKPVLFAALLKAHGQLGPAEIPSKRDWTYRQVGWLAHHHGVPLDMPAAHPFNPLPLLRLVLACATASAPGDTNRFVTEQVFQHVWRGGQDALSLERLQALEGVLQDHVTLCGRDWLKPESETVKARLRINTDEALAMGLFGVPSMVVDGHAFWGHDALPMLRAFIDGDQWFGGAGWQAAQAVHVGVHRQV